MGWQELSQALCLVLVIEGILPFAAPAHWGAAAPDRGAPARSHLAPRGTRCNGDRRRAAIPDAMTLPISGPIRR
jgi:uncharacterized protein YjeT (DUF2065 family)